MGHAVRADIVIRGMEYEHTLGVPGVHANVTLGYEPMRIQETFDAMVPGRALEVCEFSLANYITLRGLGARCEAASAKAPAETRITRSGSRGARLLRAHAHLPGTSLHRRSQRCAGALSRDRGHPV